MFLTHQDVRVSIYSQIVTTLQTRELNLGARFKERLEGVTSQLDGEIIDGDVDGVMRHLDVDLCSEDWTMMRVQQQAAVETTVPFVDRCVETPFVRRPKHVVGCFHIRLHRCYLSSNMHTVS